MTQQDRINNQREQLKLFRKSLKRYADVSGKVPKELIEEFDKKYRHYVTYFENNERRPAETAAMGRLGAEMLNDFAQIFNPNGSVNLNEEAVNYRKNMVKEADTAGTDKIQELRETLAFSECFDVYADAVSSNYGKEIFDYEEENDPQIKDWHMEVRKLEDKALNEQRELDDLRRKLLGSVVNSGLGTLFELPGNKPTNYDSIVNENFSKEKEAWKRVNSFYRNRANKDGLPKEYDIKAAIEDLKLIEDGIFEFFANELPVEGFNVTEDERVFAKQLLDTQYNLSLLIDETEANGRKFAQQVAQKAMAGEAIDDIKAQMNEAELEANRLNGYNAFIKDKIGVIRKLQQIVSNIEKLSFYKDREIEQPDLPEKPEFVAADPSEQYNLLDNYDIEELDDDEELMMLEDIDDLLSEKEREYDAVRNKIGELQVLKEEEERIRLEEEQRKEEERLRLEEEQRRKEEEERLRLEEEQRRKEEEERLRLEEEQRKAEEERIRLEEEQRRNEEERIRLEKENNKKADEKVNDMKLDDVVVNNIPEEKPEIKQNQPEIKEDPKQEEKKNEIPEINIKPENKPEFAEMKEVPEKDESMPEKPHDDLPENDYSDLYHVIKEPTEIGKRNKIQREFEINEKKNLEFEGEKVKDRNVDYAFAREYCKELQRYANYLEKTVRFYQFSNSEGFKHLQTALKPFKDMKFEGRDADLPLFPDDLAKKFDTVMAASAEYTLAHSNLDSFSPSQKERLKTCRRLDMLHDLFEKGIVLRGNRGYMKAQMAEKLVFNEAFNNLESKDPLKKAVAKQVLTKYDALKIKCNQNTAAVDEFVTALGPEHNKFKDLEKIVKIKGGKFNDKMKAFMKAKENAKQTEKKPVEINPMMK